MRRLDEIAGDLKQVLAEKFAAVVVSSSQMNEQIQEEVRGFGKHKLPAVVIAFEQGDFTDENTVRELRIVLVVVDSFVAGSDAMALQAFRHMETLLELFPPLGTAINDVFYLPGTVYSASADPTYVCYAQRLTAKQDI